MSKRKISSKELARFGKALEEEEKSRSTVSLYLREANAFAQWLGEERAGTVTKEAVVQYKECLCRKYKPASVNAKLAAVNRFVSHLGWSDCQVRALKIQRTDYQERELTKTEFSRLVKWAKKLKGQQLCHILQTIASTGIRVSELQYITVEAVEKETAFVRNKGKSRKVFLSDQLCRRLKSYCRKRGITSGPIFITRKGKPLSRTVIWARMKALALAAGVAADRVFPHNLRHLFARMFYQACRDLDQLAVILGHSSINTTRIYTRSSETEFRHRLKQLKLLI